MTSFLLLLFGLVMVYYIDILEMIFSVINFFMMIRATIKVVSEKCKKDFKAMKLCFILNHDCTIHSNRNERMGDVMLCFFMKLSWILKVFSNSKIIASILNLVGLFNSIFKSPSCCFNHQKL